MRIFKNVALLFSIIFLVACDPEIGYRYSVNNRSDKEVKVKYTIWMHDSLVIIKPNTNVVIFEEEIMGSNPHDENENFLQLFDSLKIEATDKSTLTLDYLKRENWSYSCEPSHLLLIKTGLNKYEIEISNKDFK